MYYIVRTLRMRLVASRPFHAPSQQLNGGMVCYNTNTEHKIPISFYLFEESTFRQTGV
jgi:hypothetical protein